MTLTYPQGYEALVPLWEKRRVPLDLGPGEDLPPPDCDLAALALVPVPDDPAPPALPMSNFARKKHEIDTEFAGRSQLAALHGLVVACLRRRAYPAQAPVLFRRIWAEQADALIPELSGRWLISAVITFADHGVTESERNLGQALKVMFTFVKLYEFERRFSGLNPDQPFGMKGRATAPLPLGIEPFSLKSGGLDINLLAPLWLQARDEPVMGPPALALFDRLNADPGTVLHRLARMRERVLAREARRGEG